jgi:hypothetical protein
MSVHSLLVTAAEGPKFDQWLVTATYANWIEGRENPRGGETWHVTCFDENFDDFLGAARRTGVTVEEIDGAGDEERYRLLVGEPGTGWDGAS